jgi:uncharacterized tellurite resistance protein B-like protein
MSNNVNNAKQLLKILIGTAWLDGKVQPQEQKRLRRIAEQKGVLNDSELHPWLHGLRSVSADECYQWIDEYLGQNPVAEDIQELLEEISGLIYSDGDVDSAEAQVLNQLQRKEAEVTADVTMHDTVTHAIQKLYRHWMSQ